MRPLRDCLELARGKNPQEFALEHPEPVLIGLGVLPGELQRNPAKASGTLYLSLSPDEGPVSAADDVLVNQVLAIVKRADDGEPKRVYVGGSADNDVDIPDHTVSRNHAHFDLSNGVQLVDGGSTNGTYINGARLAPETPTEVQSGDILTFGRYSFTFYDAVAFAKLLSVQAMMRPRGAPRRPAGSGRPAAQLGGAPAQLGGAPAQLGGAPAQLGGAPAQLGGAPAQPARPPAAAPAPLAGGTTPAAVPPPAPAPAAGAELPAASSPTGGASAGAPPAAPARKPAVMAPAPSAPAPSAPWGAPPTGADASKPRARVADPFMAPPRPGKFTTPEEARRAAASTDPRRAFPPSVVADPPPPPRPAPPPAPAPVSPAAPVAGATRLRRFTAWLKRAWRWLLGYND